MDNKEKISRREFMNFLKLFFVATAAGSAVSALGILLKETHSSQPDSQNNLQPETLQPMEIISEQVTQFREASSSRTDEEIKKDQEYQPSPPFYGTFYYLWSRNPLTNPADLINPNDKSTSWDYWQDNGRKPPNDFDTTYLPIVSPDFNPKSDLYDSANKKVIEWQLSQMRLAKMDMAFVSWWGQNHRTDKVFNYIIKNEMNRRDGVFPKLRFGIVYEPDLRGDKSQTEIEDDFRYLLEKYANEPAMLKIADKPVIFAYALENNGPEKVKKIANVANKLGIYYVAQVYNGYRSNETAANDWIQYAPAVRVDEQLPHSISISPGFRKRSEPAPRLPRNSAEFSQAVKLMVASQARWKLVTTYNEIGEGTGIEPARSVTFKANQAEPDTSTPDVGVEINILSQELPEK